MAEPRPSTQIPTPIRRSTEPIDTHHEPLWDEQPPFQGHGSPDYDHAAIGRGRGRASRLMRTAAGAHSDYADNEFEAPFSTPSGFKKDARAINYSETSWPPVVGGDQPVPHPYAAAAASLPPAQPQPDAAHFEPHPQQTEAALGSPFRTPPHTQNEFIEEHGVSRDPPPPPAAADRAPRPRHPPVSGSTTMVTGRGRSASAGSSSSTGGVNKDKILQDLASALEKERKRGKALGGEMIKAEEEIDHIKQSFEAYKAKQDAQFSQQQAIIAALQLEIDRISKELETAYDLSATDAAKYTELLHLSHPNLEPRPEPVTAFSPEALNKPASPATPAPPRPRKLSRSVRRPSKSQLLERQIAIAQGISPADELNRPEGEQERGRESVFRRVVRAVSRSRSRSRTRETGDGLERVETKVVPVAQDGKSRPPVAGWGAKGSRTRTRSNSLTKALKGVGRAMFPSNAPSATRAADAPLVSAPLAAVDAEPKANVETESIQAWIARSQAELARKGPPTRALSTPVVQTRGPDEAAKAQAQAMQRELSRVGLL